MPTASGTTVLSSARNETSPLLDTRRTDSKSDNSSLLDSSDSDDGSLPASYGIYSPLTPIQDDLEAEGRAGVRSPVYDPPKPAPTATMAQVIVVLLIGVLTSNADGSLVLATHPVIASDFGVLKDSSWLFVSFSLAGAATQTTYAKLSDIYGRKALLLWSYALFTIGCTMIGLGRSYWQVILGRVLSGSGGSGMTTLVAVLISDLVPLREVASWQSYLNVFATLGRSLGGPVGGWLADTIGWRWSFLGQAPLFMTAVVLCWVVLPNPQTSTDESDFTRPEPKNRFVRIDFLGAGLLGLAILALMFPLELGGGLVPWTHPLVFILFATGGILGALFLATEAWWAKEPIFPLVLLRSRDVMASYMIMGCQIAAQLGVSPCSFGIHHPASRLLGALLTLLLSDDVFSPALFPSHR